MNFTNEHGNSPLHYACFWGYDAIAEDLVHHGSKVSIANKYGDTPLDKAKGSLAKLLHDIAVECGQDLKKIKFKDQSWLGKVFDRQLMAGSRDCISDNTVTLVDSYALLICPIRHFL